MQTHQAGVRRFRGVPARTSPRAAEFFASMPPAARKRRCPVYAGFDIEPSRLTFRQLPHLRIGVTERPRGGELSLSL
jgi:hypothetical protein